MKKLVILCALIFAVGCMSTKKSLNDQHKLMQITVDDYSCKAWDNDRVEQIKTLFPKAMIDSSGASDKSLKSLYQAMSGIPDTYLKWLGKLHKEDGFTISFSDGMGIGLALYPSYIQFGNDWELVNHTAQHEIGHIVDYYVQDVTTDFDFPQNIQTVADKDYISPHINQYPISYSRSSDTYYKEYWAEAFNSFYCSPKTNKLFGEYFPEANAILRKVLLPPVWEK